MAKKKSSSKTSKKRSSAKKAPAKKVTRSKSKSARKMTRKRVTAVAPVAVSKDSSAGCGTCSTDCELSEEHRVLSHLMYILFLVAAAMAAYYTFGMLLYSKELANSPQLSFFPVKALVMLGWAYFFKMFGHRMHPPHN